MGRAKRYLLIVIIGSAFSGTACGSSEDSSDGYTTEKAVEDAVADAGEKEEFDAAALTESEVKAMSTAELVDAILRDPKMTIFSAYNDSIQALEMFRQTYNVYRELNNRDDVLETLADVYDEVEILTATDFTNSILSLQTRSINKQRTSRRLWLLCRKKNNFFHGGTYYIL